jgi:flagellar hook-associated protein 3 FlgL
MQISTNFLFDRATSQLSTIQNDLAKSQAQIAAQKQVLNPSDAPDQAAAIARLKSVLGRQESYGKSLDDLNSRLSIQGSTLENASNALIKINELAIQASNSANDPASRVLLATEMRGMRDQLLSLANSRDLNGKFIFSGSRMNTPPFAPDVQGQMVYQGDQTQMLQDIGDQRSVAMNRPGSQTFVRVVRQASDGSSAGVGFFQSIDELIDGVATSNSSAMQRGLAEVDDLQLGLVQAQSQTGSDMQVIEQQNATIQDTQLTLKSALSNLEDLDYASAITQMKKQMLALEAAQSSFVKITQLSLFSYLR